MAIKGAVRASMSSSNLPVLVTIPSPSDHLPLSPITLSLEQPVSTGPTSLPGVPELHRWDPYRFSEVSVLGHSPVEFYSYEVSKRLPKDVIQRDWIILDTCSTTFSDIETPALLHRPWHGLFNKYDLPADSYGRSVILYLEPSWQLGYEENYEALLSGRPGMNVMQFTTMILCANTYETIFDPISLLTGLLAREQDAWLQLKSMLKREDILPQLTHEDVSRNFYARHVMIRNPVEDLTSKTNVLELIVARRWSDPDELHIVAVRHHVHEDLSLTDFSDYKVYDPRMVTFPAIRRYFEQLEQSRQGGSIQTPVTLMDLGIDFSSGSPMLCMWQDAKSNWKKHCDEVKKRLEVDVISRDWWESSLDGIAGPPTHYLGLPVCPDTQTAQRKIWSNSGQMSPARRKSKAQ